MPFHLRAIRISTYKLECIFCVSIDYRKGKSEMKIGGEKDAVGVRVVGEYFDSFFLLFGTD